MANPLKWKLHWQVLASLGLAIAIVVGLNLTNSQESSFAGGLLAVCGFVGTLFMNALKMIVVPLIVASIIHGMIGLGADRHFGRLGIKTLGYYLGTGLVAVCIGLLMVNLIQPGVVDETTREAMLSNQAPVDEFEQKVQGRDAGDFVEVLIRMVPPNVFDYATDNGSLLGVIFFSLLFGFFVTRLPRNLKQVQVNFWDSVQGVMLRMADFIIAFAPIGVFALVLPKMLEVGPDLIAPVAKFFACVLLALAAHFIITMSALLYFIARVNPINHYRAMASALVTAFSTASSVSTLPLTMECVQDNAKVSERVSSFTLPLGATVNMDGTALYECVVVIFIAQFAYGGLELAMQFQVVLLALLTSVGVAGIPSASLVAIAVILGVVGLPLEYLGIVLVVDRVLDMCRTAVNIFSDSVGAVVIASTEGESGFYSEEGDTKSSQPSKSR